ncbi:MAG: glycosyltransferase [Clostridia bacterium]|nr:glycosyltransferase [Clostridia bacterium]
MEKIKHVFMTTIEASLKSFMLPVISKMDKEKYDITLMCNMSDEFFVEMSKEYNCVPLDLARGFNFKKTLFCIFKLIKEFRRIKPTIIEYGTENVSFCAAIAGWLTGVPIRLYNHWGPRYVGLTGIARVLSVIIETTAALFSTDVRQVSPRNRELCVKDHLYPAKKVKVLGYGGTVGVDFSRFQLDKKEEHRKEVRQTYSVPEEATLIGFVGRIQTDKGINELIEAFKKIYSEDNTRYLMLVGPIDSANPIKEENMKWAEECPNVIFTGRREDVYRYMSAFDLLAHPTYREGLGMVLQEAAALKLPIITTNIIGPSEFITHGFNGALAEVRDAESLYLRISELVKEPEKMKEYAENVYKYTLENFERSVMVGRIIADREELLKGIGKIK